MALITSYTSSLTGKFGYSSLILYWGSILSFVLSFLGTCEPLASNPDIHLSLVSSCNSSSTLAWSLSPGEWKVTICELTVHRISQRKADIIDIHPQSRRRQIHLFDLAGGESYTTFLVCDGNKRTNDVTFTAGSLCDSTDSFHQNHSSKPDGTEAVELSSGVTFDTINWLSAILFSCLGVTLICVVAFYTWKKYLHRQRIQRIFRHEQNDPFQALYSPTQDSYSV